MKMYFKLLCIVSLLNFAAVESSKDNPNIILVLTDDQDLVLGGLTPMMSVQQLIGNMGITFSNAFVTTPICCPSRSSLLTGQYVHNHGTVNNSVSGGCNSANWQTNHEAHTFITHLKKAGYSTFYAGKYLNQYGKPSVGGTAHIPPGWDWWLGLVGNSRYYNYTLSVNGTARHFSDDYLTDVIKAYSQEFLRQKSTTEDAFLMILAPPAPHAPFTPEPQYENHFKNVAVLQTPNFNVKDNKDKHWLLRMRPTPLPSTFIPILDEIYRKRWETLLSVDDLIKSITEQLEFLGILNNTYIIFTSDHGFHIGQFGQPWDKRQPYESDLRVPLLVRGPEIPRKHLVNQTILNIDLAPTIMDIAGLAIPEEMDGKSFFPLLKNPLHLYDVENIFLVEYFGEGDISSIDESCPFNNDNSLSECSPANLCKCQDAKNNTYTCLRHISSVDNFLYCKFQDRENFVEFYDMKSDPYQLHNIAHSMNSSFTSQCNEILSYLETCSGLMCQIMDRGVKL